MKIKDIDKLYADSNDKLTSMIKERDNALKKAEQYRIEAEASADVGDLEKYKELKARASDEEAFAYVHSKQIDKMRANPAVTEEDALEAWKDYVKSYNKDIKSKTEKFNAAKKNLLKEYAEMIDMQNNACAIREKLGYYIGHHRKETSLDGGLGELFPMEYIPHTDKSYSLDEPRLSLAGTSINDADALYFLASTITKLSKGQFLNDTLEEQTLRNVLIRRLSR